MSTLVDANNDFPLKLLKQISEDGKSSFLSPASVTAALAMTYAGAEGNTKDQMNTLMFNGCTDQEINEGIHLIMKTINEPVDGYVLKMANRLYVERSYEILQTFLDAVQKCYHSDCISSDFQTNAESVRQEINKWVEDHTGGKIRDLLARGVLDTNTRLVLVNAIYFKGDWLTEFQEVCTRKQPFHVTYDKTVDVDMMRATLKNFKYTETEKCQILAVSYKSPNVAMFFVLPTARNELRKFEQELSGLDLITLFKQVQRCEVEVELPKFKLEASFSFDKTLSEMGCVDMFTNRADFSNISVGSDLEISAIIHKAFIEVNEKGAEAAASTAVVARKKRCAAPSVETRRFIADHPFLFAIVECNTMTILFLGHYYG